MNKTPYISIDYGTRKSGLAYCSEGFCFTWKTVPTSKLLTVVPALLKEKKAEGIVIGMPYNIDGSEGVHAKRVRLFSKKLAAVCSVPILFHDERLTTSEAIIAFDSYNFHGDLDAEAARLILEDFLKHHSSS